jgi:hypothetical protein
MCGEPALPRELRPNGGRRKAVNNSLLPLNFTNFGWPVLLMLRTSTLQLKIIPRLRKPNSTRAIAANHSHFNRS